jgi:hypothetical protein
MLVHALLLACFAVRSMCAAALAEADVVPADRCVAAKLRAAGKKAADKLRCHARAATRDSSVDAVCLARAEARFTLAVAKADRLGPCAGTTDPIETLVDACVDALVSNAPSTPSTGRCIAAKRTAAGNAAAGKLGCYAKDAIRHDPSALAGCLLRADQRFAAAFAKSGSCDGDAPTIDGDVGDVCVNPVVSTVSTLTTTTTSLPACCGAQRITFSGGAGGTMRAGGLAPFPLPPGIITVLDVGPPDATCRHGVTLPAGGFVVPAFCVPSLQFTLGIAANGCESGDGTGAGDLWDGHAGERGGIPQTNVSSAFDSSDGSCDPGTATCSARKLNMLGDTDVRFSPGGDPDTLSTHVSIPVHMRMWEDSQGCPGDGIFNSFDGDVLIPGFFGESDFMLTLTTGTATGQFADKNGDGCALPFGATGFGASSQQCAAGPNGPCAVAGASATGPCCQVGQGATLVAASAALTNSFPMYDVGMTLSIPSTVSSCGTAVPTSCVVTTDPCLQ